MKIVTILVALSVSTVSLHATNVLLSGSSILLSDATTAVPENSVISVGYFNGGFSDFAGLNTRTWADVNTTDYIELFTSTVSPAGELSGGSSETGILGEQLYVWVFNATTDPVTVGGQEYGLFSGSDPEWTAKGDSLVPPDNNNISVSIIDVVVFGTDLGTNVSLQAVPEPSAFALLAGAFGIAAVMVRRRR